MTRLEQKLDHAIDKNRRKLEAILVFFSGLLFCTCVVVAETGDILLGVAGLLFFLAILNIKGAFYLNCRYAKKAIKWTREKDTAPPMTYWASVIVAVRYLAFIYFYAGLTLFAIHFFSILMVPYNS